MTIQNNKQFLDDQPHGHLQDGSAKAFERIARAFSFLTMQEQHQLVDRTFLQTDASGRSQIRHDTGHRIVTSSEQEIEQSLLFKHNLKAGWHNSLIAIPHPVYAPNRPKWLCSGQALFRNEWVGSDVTRSIPNLGVNDVVVPCPPEWDAFMKRLFANSKMCPPTADGSIPTDNLHFIDEFTIWLAFSLFSNFRPLYAPILRGAHGTGKGTMESQVIKPFVGGRNHIKVMPHNIKGEHGGQFLIGKSMVVFDEVNDRGQVFGDRLKNLVTETDLAVNPKNLAPFVDTATFSTMILSNEEVPIGYPEGERRFLVSPFMEHEVDQAETGDWLFNEFVPWMKYEGGHGKLGKYLKWRAATNTLPSVAWKSPWFHETCKTDTNADHETAIMSWLDDQEDKYGYTVAGLSAHFKAGNGVVKTCLDASGYKRGKIKGTHINVYKKKDEVGTLHWKLSKD